MTTLSAQRHLDRAESLLEQASDLTLRATSVWENQRIDALIRIAEKEIEMYRLLTSQQRYPYTATWTSPHISHSEHG